MTRLFVLTKPFERQWNDLGLSDEHLQRLENEILKNPKLHPVMRGTGRLRKMRFAIEGRGKSRSVRVLYVDFESVEQIHLIGVFDKSEKDNLTLSERNAIKRKINEIEHDLLQVKVL